MNNNNENRGKATSGGIGFCGLLAVVFIVLKLTGVIAWGWGWVLSPLWIPTAAAVLWAVFVLVIIRIIRKKF